jgi:uncharacterized coiled-coil protein SlyX
MPLDPETLDRLRETKAEIDKLQTRLKELVEELREKGATAQEIGEAIRSS